jgi:hypothetical protein
VNQSAKQFGELNPKAPPELARFRFLLGRWRCEAKLKLADGGWQTFAATWAGRTILDGYAIADEYCMMGAQGQPIVLGMNFRSYSAARKAWSIKWLDALSGLWTDLGTEELGGVQFEGDNVVYGFKEPMAGHAYTRATYRNISDAHFTWRGESSNDRKNWKEFMVVECYRQEP